MKPASPPDIPFDVQGYITDPQRVGFQVLTNYESTYWRAVVGTDAWSLYEVLRSFCHANNKTCFPSINLLTAILGLKQRRILTGWETQSAGKTYRYPGLIEILQEHELIIAEVQGEGRLSRYVFHVNLTPGLLTEKQVGTLPSILQEKYAELLKRCEEEMATLRAKRRPPKFSQEKSEEDSGKNGAIDKLSIGYDKLSIPIDNLSIEQQPINNTQLTERARVDHNNNNKGQNGHEEPAVVVALVNFGLSKRVATGLAQKYSLDHIEAKIDYLTYLQHQTPDKLTNPRGWLRKAIEEDYGPPDGYKSSADREAEAQWERELQERQAALAEEKDRRQQEEEAAAERRQRELREQYGTTEQEAILWQQVLDQLKFTHPGFLITLQDACLLQAQKGNVLIGVPTDTLRRILTEHPGNHRVMRDTLAAVLRQPVTLNFTVLGAAPESVGSGPGPDRGG